VTYADGLSELRRIATSERDAGDLNPECYSLAFLHGRRVQRAIILWHGFTNCPQQFAELGKLFFGHGYNVYIPLIPRHGRSDRMTDALAGLTGAELKVAALSATRIAFALAERVDTAGLSVGGVMAAWIGQSARVDTAMAISPFFALPFFSQAVNRVATDMALALPNFWLWWDPSLKENTKPLHAYPRFPSHALASSMQFGDGLFRLAGHVPPLAQRCVLTVNDKDPAVNNAVSAALWTEWSRHAEMVQTYTFTNLERRHDIIELTTYPDARRLVYPVLVDLILRADGKDVPIPPVRAT
jgi:hypothetical protein